MQKFTDRSPRFIARQMAVGFGSVTVVAVAMCAMLLAIINDVSGLVAGMRHDEASIRQGFELATTVRDLSIHTGHAIVDADDQHVDQPGEWKNPVRAQIERLKERIPDNEHWRFEIVTGKSHRMHDLLVDAALPAARRGDVSAARSVQREIAQLGQEAAEQADALARAAASQMENAHILATKSTRLGLIGGGVCVALVVGLSFGFTVRLRAAVVKPLVTLTEAARRFGQGDFALRVGKVGRGELEALAEAFDRMAEELTQREARLLRSERMAAIGQLAAGIAHELNNPIGIIRGYLKTMTPDGDRDLLRQELSILDEETSHCQRMAEDLLSYAGTRQLSLERIQAKELLRETARRFGESPAAAGLRIDIDVDDARLECDGARVRQVLLNLLTNASQASPPDDFIVLRGRAVGPFYEIEVEDHGPGVELADRERIFEPFFSKRRGGSGLGLAVCEGIVTAHGGTIAIAEVAPHGGAIFRARLPIGGGASEERTTTTSR